MIHFYYSRYLVVGSSVFFEPNPKILFTKVVNYCLHMPYMPKRTIFPHQKIIHHEQTTLKERSKDWYPNKTKPITPLAVRIENFIQGVDSRGNSILRKPKPKPPKQTLAAVRGPPSDYQYHHQHQQQQQNHQINHHHYPFSNHRVRTKYSSYSPPEEEYHHQYNNGYGQQQRNLRQAYSSYSNHYIRNQSPNRRSLSHFDKNRIRLATAPNQLQNHQQQQQQPIVIPIVINPVQTQTAPKAHSYIEQNRQVLFDKIYSYGQNQSHYNNKMDSTNPKKVERNTVLQSIKQENQSNKSNASRPADVNSYNNHYPPASAPAPYSSIRPHTKNSAAYFPNPLKVHKGSVHRNPSYVWSGAANYQGQSQEHQQQQKQDNHPPKVNATVATAPPTNQHQISEKLIATAVHRSILKKSNLLGGSSKGIDDGVEKLFINPKYESQASSTGPSGAQTPSTNNFHANSYAFPAAAYPFKKMEITTHTKNYTNNTNTNTTNTTTATPKDKTFVKNVLYKKKTVAERMFDNFHNRPGVTNTSYPPYQSPPSPFDPQPADKAGIKGGSGSGNKRKLTETVTLDADGKEVEVEEEEVNMQTPHEIDRAFIPQTLNKIADLTKKTPQPFGSVNTYWRMQRNSMNMNSSVPTAAQVAHFSTLGHGNDNANEDIIIDKAEGEHLRKLIRDMRKWEYTTLGKLVGDKKSDRTSGGIGDGTRFSVFSFNVLSPKLLKAHPYLYKNCNPAWLDWNYRKNMFLKDVADYEPDVLCLQEVEGDLFFLWYEPELSKFGYRGVFKKRAHEKTDGCAIFYKNSKFNLLDKLGVDFYQPHVPLLNRDNIGLLVKLQSLHGRRPKVVIGTTHLLFNQKRQDVKLGQVQLLLAEMERFSFCGFEQDGNSKYLPIIVTGDFNTEPYGPIARFVTDGFLNLVDDFGRPSIALKNGLNDFLPNHFGVSDQCQHYRILLERYKMWKLSHKPQFEVDMNTQSKLVNISFSEWVTYKDIESEASRKREEEIQEKVGMNSSSSTIISTSTMNDPNNPSDQRELDTKSSLSSSSHTSYTNVNGITKIGIGSPVVDHVNRDVHATILQEIYKSGILCTFGSGELSHRLRLKNVYAPRLDRKDNNESCATTKQTCWTTVDYIFYSMVWNETLNKQTEGQLKLLRRLGLLTRSHCKEYGPLPNPAIPSDHFSLCAEFLLK